MRVLDNKLADKLSQLTAELGNIQEKRYKAIEDNLDEEYIDELLHKEAELACEIQSLKDIAEIKIDKNMNEDFPHVFTGTTRGEE